MNMFALRLFSFLPFTAGVVSRRIEVISPGKTKGQVATDKRKAIAYLSHGRTTDILVSITIGTPMLLMAAKQEVVLNTWTPSTMAIIPIVSILVYVSNMMHKMWHESRRLSSLPYLLVMDTPPDPTARDLLQYGPDEAVQSLLVAGWTPLEIEMLDRSLRVLVEGQKNGILITLEGQSLKLLQHAVWDMRTEINLCLAELAVPMHLPGLWTEDLAGNLRQATHNFIIPACLRALLSSMAHDTCSLYRLTEHDRKVLFALGTELYRLRWLPRLPETKSKILLDDALTNLVTLATGQVVEHQNSYKRVSWTRNRLGA